MGKPLALAGYVLIGLGVLYLMRQGQVTTGAAPASSAFDISSLFAGTQDFGVPTFAPAQVASSVSSSPVTTIQPGAPLTPIETPIASGPSVGEVNPDTNQMWDGSRWVSRQRQED